MSFFRAPTGNMKGS